MAKHTVGVCGTGEIGRRMLKSIVDDFMESLPEDDTVKFILPVSDDLFTAEVELIADLTGDYEGVAIEVVTDGTEPKDADDLIEEAVKVHKVKKVERSIASVAAEEDGVAWVLSVDSDSGYRLFDEADREGIKAFDVCDGMEELSFGDDEDDEVEEAQEDAEEETGVDEEAEAAAATKSDVAAKSYKELKADLEALGVSLNRKGKGRISKDAVVAATLDHDETGHLFYLQNEDGTGIIRVDADLEPVDEPIVGEEAEEAEVPDKEVDADTGEVDPSDAPEADEEAPETPDSDAEAAEVPEDDAKPKKRQRKPKKAAAAKEEAPKKAEEPVQENTTAPSATVPTHASLVGSCAACGGPIFASPFTAGDSGFPEVRWSHAPACSLAGEEKF